MSTATLDYRESFLAMLSNREKDRTQGFVVFVHGTEDLAVLEELCFSPEQTWNRNGCFTARYGAGRGEVLTTLIPQLVLDAQAYLATYNPNIPSQSVKSSTGGVSLLGQLRTPTALGEEWISMFGSLATDRNRNELSSFFSAAQSHLRVGQRLVLFCELTELGQDCKLEDIGFDEALVNQLRDELPERVGLVFSGLPLGLELSTALGNRFLDIELDPNDITPRGLPPKGSQPLKNDNPYGPDALAITGEVNALADAIVGKDMEPPLVVGILGGWGSGKSFILYLLKQRLSFIRNQDLSDDKVRETYPYVGHPYLVRFDAWTYAKSDLWASLMQSILFDLDQQLNLEKVVAPLGILEKGFDLWGIIANSSPTQLQELQGKLDQKAIQEAIKRITDWKQGGATASALWSALKSLNKEELDKLDKVRKKLERKKKKSAEALHKAQIESEQKLLAKKQEFDKQLATEQQAQRDKLAKPEADLKAAQADVAARLEQEARKEAWMPVFGEFRKFFGALADSAMLKSGVTSENAPISVWMIEKEIKSFKKYWAGLWQSPASLALLGFALVSSLATWYLTKAQTELTFPALASYTGAVGGALASVHTALTKVNSWFEQEQSRYETQLKIVREDEDHLREKMEEFRREADIEGLETKVRQIQTKSVEEIKAIEERAKQELKQQEVEDQKKLADQKHTADLEIQKLEDQVAEQAQRAGIPGQSRSLTDLIQKRIQSGYYQERLGMLHQVQNDLQEITEALLTSSEHNQTLFPRGTPRIILLIDDLDRCPPKQVVQVLEAAQLLVKTKLFVVIIAMDVRYITRALEKEYEGILVHEGDPSGLDYAEKIVQIPYRVRPISPAAMPTYLRSQMKVRQSSAEAVTPISPDIHRPERRPAKITAPGQASTRVNETLPPEIQQFEEEEFEIMTKMANAAEISPRATKRLVNVMKLIKNIWYRRNVAVPRAEVQQAMVFFLTLSASYPEALARVLDELDRCYRDTSKYDPSCNVRNTLLDIINQWSVREGIIGDWAEVRRLIEMASLLDGELTLEMLGPDNLQIVRSFSFLGEVEMPLVEKKMKHAIEVLSNGPEASFVTRPRNSRTNKKATR